MVEAKGACAGLYARAKAVRLGLSRIWAWVYRNRAPSADRVALRTSGLVATTLFDGATNGERFLAYVTDTLFLVFKRGDTVILDNLNVHKVAEVRETIEAAGARLLYLPAYSPDFNPIEQAFARLKALLRTAAARTLPDLWAAIQNAFKAFHSHECRSYVAAAGYDAFDPP